MNQIPRIKDFITYKEYIEAITITKKRLKVGKNYSPYLINKSLMSWFIKTNNFEGILFLNNANMFMGSKSKLSPNYNPELLSTIPKQWHFDYVMNTHLTSKLENIDPPLKTDDQNLIYTYSSKLESKIQQPHPPKTDEVTNALPSNNRTILTSSNPEPFGKLFK